MFLNFLLIEAIKNIIHANWFDKDPFSLQQDSLWPEGFFYLVFAKKIKLFNVSSVDQWSSNAGSKKNCFVSFIL